MEGSRPGFDLEQLPTTYTNKWAIFRNKMKGEEGEKGAHREEYLTLWVTAGKEGQPEGHNRVTNEISFVTHSFISSATRKELLVRVFCPIRMLFFWGGGG